MESKDMSDMISCPICMETLEEPKALPCLHTFCKLCIDSYICKSVHVNTGDIQYFVCPICRKKVHGPKGKDPKEWANILPHNHLIATLKDTVRGDRNRLVCSHHEDKPAEFYCFDHDTFVCSICVLKHRKCSEIDSIENAVQDCLAKDKEFKEKVRIFTDICSKRQMQKEQIEKRSAVVKSKIRTWKKEMSEALDQFERTLTEQLDQEIDQETDILAQYMDDCQIQIGKIISAKNEYLDPSKPNEIILKGKNKVKEVLDNVDQELSHLAADNHPELKVDFKAEMPVPNKFSNSGSFGKLILQRQPVSKSLTQMPQCNKTIYNTTLNPHARIFNPSYFSTAKENKHQKEQQRRKGIPSFTQRLDVKLPNDRGTCYITGATFLPNGVLVLCDHDNGKIKFFDKELNFVSQMGFNSDPWDVAADAAGGIVVSFPDDKMLINFRVENGQVVGTGYTIRTRARCYGVAINDNVMVFTCRDQHTSSVHVMSLASNSEMGRWSIPTPKNGGIWYVAFNADGTIIYVTNDDKNCIICLSLKGDHLLEIHSPALQKPRGVTHVKDYMFVACKHDLNNSLQQEQFQLDTKRHLGYTSASVISADSTSSRLLLAFHNLDDSDNFCSLFAVPSAVYLSP